MSTASVHCKAKVMASPNEVRRYDDRPSRTACRNGSKPMIETLWSLTEEEYRKRVAAVSAWGGEQ